MIKLNLQMFAKSTSQMQEYRKSRAITKYAQEAKVKAEEKKTEEQKQEAPRKPTGGEVVTRVNPRDQYIVYKIEAGKQVPVAIRTGEEILKKMIYNPAREGWISKLKGLRYIIRKKL